MNPTLDAVLRSWPFDPWVVVPLLLTAGVYLRGWRILYRRDPQRWPGTRPAFFLGGLAAIGLALASPIEPFSVFLLQVHMVQHMLLMMAAPPLLWLGAPMFPLLRGLPQPIRTYWVAPLFRAPRVRRFLERMTHPIPPLLLFVVATWLWHIPPVYDLALGSSFWHYLQHLTFLVTALLFWHVVIRPYPSRPRWSLWLLVPFLLLADVQNTVLSAFLAFSDQVWYAHYAQMPRLGGISALDDQAVAGVIMWVPGSLAFLLPLFGIGIQLLYGSANARATSENSPVRPALDSWPTGSRLSLPLISTHPVTPSPRPKKVTPSPFDLLRLPLLGRFLKWRYARLALQLPLLLLAGVVIFDGLSGPQISAMNLAGVLPWIHWRGFVVLGLLAAGNLFCMGCPFLLPRMIGRRWLPRGWPWPRWLRTKWLAVLLIVLFLWAYEVFALWDSPWLTAWIAIGYFVTAFVVDGLFRGGSFCKYVCPIGQFNFVQSLVSPLEVQVRDPAVCAACRTKDCIRGRDGIPGCELKLFQPRKSSNLDCTFCLDCIHACPHDNIGIRGKPPAAELWQDPARSGLGRFGKRPDVAALVLVLVFGAFANAAGMVGPVAEWQQGFGALIGQRSVFLTTTIFYLVTLVMLPLVAVGTAAALSRWWGRLTASWLDVATRYAYALVPLGFGMWLTHYGFHFLTSLDTVVPTVQRFTTDQGWIFLGSPEWVGCCCRPVLNWLLRLEILFLDLGLLLSLYTGYRIARSQASSPGQTLKILAPWAMLMVVLFAAGIWIVFQPMQMRGTLEMTG